MGGDQGALKVLLADDDVVVRRVVAAILKKLGHETDEAVDGRDAAGKLDSGSYDLLVLDVQMPHRTGIELIENLRERGGRTPVIIMSSALSDEIRDRCARAGRGVCIDKPVDKPTLEAAIASVLKSN